MSIATTVAKLQEINRASSGIATAPDTYPPALNASELPIAISLPGPADWREQAQGLRRQNRTYVIRVYVRPVAQGVGVYEGYAACEPILNALGNTYLGNLTLDDTVDHCSEWRDGGIRGDLDYAGTAYHGFEFSLLVTEKTST